MRPLAGEQLIREARASAPGPSVAAFFDLDRTLVQGYSAIHFFLHRLRSRELPLREILSTVGAALAFRAGRIDFTAFLAASAKAAEGVAEHALRQLGEDVFEQTLVSLIYPEAERLVEAHLQRGHFVAIVTSATQYQVEPIARRLGVEYVACSAIEIERGVATGRVVLPTCYGEGKLESARRFAERHPIDLDASYFYTDSHEDLPLLEAVGRPRPVNPTPELGRVASVRGWSLHAFEPRPAPFMARVDAFASRWRGPVGRAPRPRASEA